MKIVRILCTAAVCMLAMGSCKKEQDTGISIETSDARLANYFEWAVRKAESFVMTGKTGVVDRSEMSEGDGEAEYIPSYWAGYPFRTAFYSRDFCHQMSGAHILGYEAENREMLKAFAASADSAKLWYPLWAINFDGSVYTLDYRGDDDFVREVPAVFELVEKAYKMYRWTGNRKIIEDPVLWNYYTKAVTDFISLHDGIIPNGIAEGDGSGRIFKGVATYNEYIVPLVEAGDGLGCQYQAMYSYAQMLRARGNTEEANSFTARTESLKKYANEVWSVCDTSSFFVRGYSADGSKYTDFGRENSWFMPLKSLLEPSEKMSDYLTFIHESAAEVRDGANIEGLTYLPDVFFAWNRVEEGWFWIKHIMSSLEKPHVVSLVGPNSNYPEVAYTAISQVVENMLGVEPDAPNHAVYTLSRLPEEVDYLGVNNIPVGDHRVNVMQRENRKTILKHVEGNKELVCYVRFYGKHSQMKINGSVFTADSGMLNGEEYSYVKVSIPVGEEATVETIM